MRLLASGRASEIIALDEARVLRRFKAGGDPAREAEVMEYVRHRGFPVPRVHEVLDDALVLERIPGPTMGAHLRRRPWSLPAQAAELARLHTLLHTIAAPPGMTVAGTDDRLVHLDLHPDNVIVSPTGSVVIDWTNAVMADGPLDVAVTWVVLVTSGGPGGRLFCRLLLRHFDRESLIEALPRAAAFRLVDANVTDAERDRVRRLLERVG